MLNLENTDMTNAQLFAQAKEMMPGGVNSPLRGFAEVYSEPICIKRGSGAYVYDVENNRYTDFLLGFGPAILGHAPAEVEAALMKQASKGSVYASTNLHEIELASYILSSTPYIEKVRFVCSGTEAVMSAVRLAKGATGREKILKFYGSYHGHADAVLGTDQTDDNRYPIKGVDKSIHANTLLAHYNDLSYVEKLFSIHGMEIACVLIEPYACNMGLIKPVDGFIQGLRQLCDRYGALLVFDEVITGFRMAFGSVYKDFQVEPDLLVFGKVIGGGTPIGAYAGKNAIMQLVSQEEQGVYQSGTFAGNALSMAAGVATLQALSDPLVYDELEQKGAYLENQIMEGFKRNRIPYRFIRKGSVFSFSFCKDGRSIKNYADIEMQDFSIFARVHASMLKKGFLLPPAADEVLHLCTKHTHDDITQFADQIVLSIIETL